MNSVEWRRNKVQELESQGSSSTTITRLIYRLGCPINSTLRDNYITYLGTR
jgi:hypothetical protein